MKCQSCKKEYTGKSQICPHCGARQPEKAGGVLKAVLGTVLLVISAMSLVGNLMRCFAGPLSLASFTPLAPAMCLAAVLMILGIGLIDPKGKFSLLFLPKILLYAIAAIAALLSIAGYFL